jgi:hypothetical protein
MREDADRTADVTTIVESSRCGGRAVELTVVHDTSMRARYRAGRTRVSRR